MNFLKSFFKRPNAFLAFFVFSGLVFYVGYQLGKTPEQATPKAQIIIPFLLSLPLAGVTVLNSYLDLQIREETNERKMNLQKQYDTEEIQKKKLIDFLSLVNEQVSLERVAYDTSLRLKGETEERFRSRLRNNGLDFQNSQEAVNGLLSSKKDDKGKDIYLLKAIAITALENIGIPKTHPKFEDKFRHIYAYLRAWLICGIRHNTYELPIEWIQENSLSIQEQIDALNFIKNKLLNDDKLKKQISNENSRKVIGRYLDELIKKIKEY